MSEMRNPITREENFSNPAGNVMMELQEADLNKFVAGAGETRNSGGVLCTSTAECYFGTLLKLAALENNTGVDKEGKR